MNELQFADDVLARIRARGGPTTSAAYLFVLAAIEYLQSRLDVRRHVTGAELAWACRDFALEQFGLLAPHVLEHWGITSGPRISAGSCSRWSRWACWSPSRAIRKAISRGLRLRGGVRRRLWVAGRAGRMSGGGSVSGRGHGEDRVAGVSEVPTGDLDPALRLRPRGCADHL